MKEKVLIMRFSAMGDVAMLVPVVQCLATEHPEVEITVLTKTFLKPLFGWLPENVSVRGINTKDYEGLRGLYRLYKELQKEEFTAVADVHDVLRTKVLRTYFKRLGHTKVASIDKGRGEKRKLLGRGQEATPLTHSTHRYAKVLERLGLPIHLDKGQFVAFDNEELTALEEIVGRKAEHEKWIGVAPFAAHNQKVYPLEKMEQVVKTLAEEGNRVFLFGAGKQESEILSGWQGEGITSICGKMGGLKNELLLMSQLDVMISMDSANMHMAAMMGTTTLSIWGATHPKAGFTGWKQGERNVLEDKTLACRPCSVFGKEPCKWGDMRCMHNITPEMVVNQTKALLDGNKR